MNLTSPDFQNGNRIPKQFTCNRTTPPTLTISISEELKESFNSYAMFLLDIDAPKQKNTGMRGWCHWLVPFMSTDVVEISANNITELRESKQIIESYNSYGSRHYRGPCPPSGIHRYFFCLYALSTSLVGFATAEFYDSTSEVGLSAQPPEIDQKL